MYIPYHGKLHTTIEPSEIRLYRTKKVLANGNVVIKRDKKLLATHCLLSFCNTLTIRWTIMALR